MLPSTSRVITEAANNTKNSNSLLPTQRKRDQQIGVILLFGVLCSCGHDVEVR